MQVLPAIPVFAPLLGAALLSAVNKLIPRWLAFLFAIAVAACCLVACCLLFNASLADTLVYWFGNWQPRNGVSLGISFTIDPFGAGMASISSLLMVLALVFASAFFDGVGTLFPALMLIFLGALCGFTLTGDFFNMFVFFELMSATAYTLCAYKSAERGPLQGSLNFAVTNTIGASFIAVGLALLYARSGALNLAQIGESLSHAQPDALVIAAFVFITSGFFVKAAVVPFHFWLADAHAVAPTPVCVIFSGIMVEVGLFGALRLYWTVFSGAFASSAAHITDLLVTLGVITTITGGLMCFGQRHLKRMLAFSTISHMGILVISFGLLTPEALAGTQLYILGHALTKSALFMCCGLVLHRYHSLDEFELRRRGQRDPWLLVLFVIGALSLIGIPGSGIWRAEGIFDKAYESSGYGWLKYVALFGATLTGGAVLRVAWRIFGSGGRGTGDDTSAPQTKEKPETPEQSGRLSILMWGPCVLLAVAGLTLGWFPILAPPAQLAAERFVDCAGYTAHVLSAKPLPSYPVTLLPSPELSQGLFATALAIVVAALALAKEDNSQAARTVLAPIRWLGVLHSGHVGDYAAWLTFGIAVIGLTAVWLIH